MLLLTEYFVRSNSIKGMLKIPCSFFLTNKKTNDKLAVTINNGYNTSDLVVKHWLFDQCLVTQVLPSIKEFIVPRDQIFTNKNIIICDYKLLSYEEEGICVNLNSIQHPMPETTYNSFCDNILNTSLHQRKRLNWLWEEFIRIYDPNLWAVASSFYHYRSNHEIAEDQRFLVSDLFPEKWLYWLKWRKYILDFEGIPGELIFYKEYN